MDLSRKEPLPCGKERDEVLQRALEPGRTGGEAHGGWGMRVAIKVNAEKKKQGRRSAKIDVQGSVKAPKAVCFGKMLTTRTKGEIKERGGGLNANKGAKEKNRRQRVVDKKKRGWFWENGNSARNKPGDGKQARVWEPTQPNLQEKLNACKNTSGPKRKRGPKPKGGQSEKNLGRKGKLKAKGKNKLHRGGKQKAFWAKGNKKGVHSRKVARYLSTGGGKVKNNPSIENPRGTTIIWRGGKKRSSLAQRGKYRGGGAIQDHLV